MKKNKWRGCLDKYFLIVFLSVVMISTLYAPGKAFVEKLIGVDRGTFSAYCLSYFDLNSLKSISIMKADDTFTYIDNPAEMQAIIDQAKNVSIKSTTKKVDWDSYLSYATFVFADGEITIFTYSDQSIVHLNVLKNADNGASLVYDYFEVSSAQ